MRGGSSVKTTRRSGHCSGFQEGVRKLTCGAPTARQARWGAFRSHVFFIHYLTYYVICLSHTLSHLLLTRISPKYTSSFPLTEKGTKAKSC